MIQAKWGDMRWEITDNVFKTISTISTSQSVKKQTNNDNEGSSATSTQGLELQTVPLIFNVVRGLGVDPYEEFKKWQSRLTKVNALYVGNKRFGSLHMQLDSVGFNPSAIDNAGNILAAEISLNFTESAEEASESKSNGTANGNAPDYYKIIPRESLGASQADKKKLKFKEIRLDPYAEANQKLKNMDKALAGIVDEYAKYPEATVYFGPFF